MRQKSCAECLGELEKGVETLAYGSCSYGIFRNPNLSLTRYKHGEPVPISWIEPVKKPDWREATNPTSDKERDVNPASPDYISSALNTRPRNNKQINLPKGDQRKRQDQLHDCFSTTNINRPTYSNALIMSSWRASVGGCFRALLNKSVRLFIPGSFPKPSIQLKDMPLSAEDVVGSILIDMVLFIE